MRAGLTKRGMTAYAATLTQAKKLDLQISPLAKVRVRSVTTAQQPATLVLCSWMPSLSYLYANGKVLGGSHRYWVKQTVGLRSVAGTWRIDTVETAGKCPGGPPAP